MTVGNGRPGRRGRPGHDLAAVLAAAVELFNERGYEATTMEDVARRLGVSKSALYHHVAGKEDLLRLAVDRALDGLFGAFAEVDRHPGPAVDRLEHLLRASVLVLVERLEFVTLLLRVRGNTEVERRALRRRREFDRLVTELMRQAVAEGGIRQGTDPALAARLAFGTVNSVIEWYRPRRDPAHPGLAARELADAVCELVFAGLRPARPGPGQGAAGPG